VLLLRELRQKGKKYKDVICARVIRVDAVMMVDKGTGIVFSAKGQEWCLLRRKHFPFLRHSIFDFLPSVDPTPNSIFIDFMR
jgi:hypothetical protein